MPASGAIGARGAAGALVYGGLCPVCDKMCIFFAYAGGRTMRWHGKLLGFVAGFLLFRPNPVFGGLLGLLIGHAFDANWFGVDNNAPYRVLGVDPAASDAEIDTAYRRLISQYHPDKVAGAAPELQAAAQKKAAEINAAYDRIQQLRAKR